MSRIPKKASTKPFLTRHDNKARLNRDECGFGPVAHAEFPRDPIDVIAHCEVAEMQRGANFLVCESFGREFENLFLAWTEFGLAISFGE